MSVPKFNVIVGVTSNYYSQATERIFKKDLINYLCTKTATITIIPDKYITINCKKNEINYIDSKNHRKRQPKI